MTEKENFLRLLRGEMPAFLPKFDMMGWGVLPSVFNDRRTPDGGGFDMFGVEFVATREAAGGALPVPGKFILDDITRWRDVIRVPSLDGVDWEAAARKDLKDKDTVHNPVNLSIGDFFQRLMAFMGFTEGLCAMYEEPEEVYALFDYLCDFYCEMLRRALPHYKPDVFVLADDTATAQNPFISPQMYRDLVKPFHKRLADIALDRGLPVEMHNCGRCEDSIDDWIDIGVSAWDPAQVTNNLLGIREKYGRRLALIGCWDTSGPVSWLDSDDRLLRDALIEYVDTFAPGGGFCYNAYVMGARDDPDAIRKMGIINEVYWDYARNWYDMH